MTILRLATVIPSKKVTATRHPAAADKMMRMLHAALALFLVGAVSNSRAQQKDDTLYQTAKREDHPEFLLSITRLTACKIPGAPITYDRVRIPIDLYPIESRKSNEEGKVVMLFIFDPDWCVRKATIVQSSGFYRLDNVSLQIAMTLKFKIEAKRLVDGQPAVRFPINWSITGLATR